MKERPAGRPAPLAESTGQTTAEILPPPEKGMIVYDGHGALICEECGSEYEYRRVRLYGMVLDIGSCPRHAPDPVSRILEMSK